MNIPLMNIYLTNRCNLACTYCFVENRNQKTIDGRIARKAVRLLFRLSGDERQLILTLFGGEPTIEFDLLKKLILYAEKLAKEKSKKINFNLVSNGTLMNQEKINFLKSHRIFLLLSMDGDLKTQNLHRAMPDGKGSFDLVYKNLEKIVNTLSPWTGVNMTVTPKTARWFFQNIRFFLENKVVKIAFNIVYEDYWDVKSLDVFQKQLTEAINLWVDYFPTKKRFWLQPIHHFIKNELDPKKNKVYFWAHPCKNARIGVSVDGGIYPCHRMVAFNNYQIGTVEEGVINHSLWEKYFNEKKKLFSQYPSCGGCPSLNYQINKDVKKPLTSFFKFSQIYKKAAQKAISELGERYGYQK